MLEANGLRICYGAVPAVHDVTFKVQEGQIVSIIGANGAGKTTLLKAIAGVQRISAGRISFLGEKLDGLPANQIVTKGISHVPEGRHIFSELSVKENLLIGAYTVKDASEVEKKLRSVYKTFPILEERSTQRGGTLSGGEQQMLAIARGLMSGPRLLMLDEPSLGIMPTVVRQIFDIVRKLRSQGTTVLLVEQNVRKGLEIADKAYVLQTGRCVLEGTGDELLQSDMVRKHYLGL